MECGTKVAVGAGGVKLLERLRRAISHTCCNAERDAWSESSPAAISHHRLEEDSLALSKTEPWSNVISTCPQPLHAQHMTSEHTLLDFTPRSERCKVKMTQHPAFSQSNLSHPLALQPLWIVVGEYSVTLRNTTLSLVYFYSLILQLKFWQLAFTTLAKACK